jgi:hypothetical protein
MPRSMGHFNVKPGWSNADIGDIYLSSSLPWHGCYCDEYSHQDIVHVLVTDTKSCFSTGRTYTRGYVATAIL